MLGVCQESQVIQFPLAFSCTNMFPVLIFTFISQFPFLPVSSSEQCSEESGSVPASLLEEQIRQRSSIVFNIDEDDYLVSDMSS